MRLSISVFAVVLAVAASGCSSSRGHDSPVVVSAAGRVGPLRLDRSDRAAVVRFAGKPDAERHGRGGLAAYRALGYACSERSTDVTFPLVFGRRPFCRTVFWLDVPSGVIEDFFTSDPRYVEAHGIRIGDASHRAERLLHRRLYLGCEENIRLESRRGSLTVAFAGGKPTRDRSGGLHVGGARVYAFALHSLVHGSGVFDCL